MLLMTILPDMGLFSLTAKVSGFLLSASGLKEFYCTTNGRFLWPGKDPLIVWIY